MQATEGKPFFFEKRNQKTFWTPEHGRCRRHKPGAKVNRSFLLLFSKKKGFLLSA
jgi:hypothetical protein